MLSAGFATVTYLRSRLMPQEAGGETEWDAAVAALGKSVARKFDHHTSRRFEREADAVDIFTARASAWVLRRFPVETLASVELRDSDGTLHDQDTGEWQLDSGAGLLQSPDIAGTPMQQIKITYTGGYWLDPRDGTAMPAEATELPEDVLEAWVLQCQHEAESRGLFHAVSFRSQKDEGSPKTSNAGLLEAVTETLRPFRRFGGE